MQMLIKLKSMMSEKMVLKNGKNANILDRYLIPKQTSHAEKALPMMPLIISKNGSQRKIHLSQIRSRDLKPLYLPYFYTTLKSGH